MGESEICAPVLSVRDLRVEFATRYGILKAIDGISFEIGRGEVLGVIGESGAGKSVTGAALIGLIDPPGRVVGGEIRLSGERIDALPAERLRQVRGKRIGMIFQDPLTSLNPVYHIGKQLVETIRTHSPMSAAAARRRAIELLAEVGIPAPDKRIDAYPHEFSGGMRQRVVIALSLCGDPELIIADEPTTALDVSVQAQVIELLKRLGRERGVAIMLITHDMGVISEAADRVAVMYAGRIAEIGTVRDLVKTPHHPYSIGLMGAIPTLTQDASRLVQIGGSMPGLTSVPPGCAFHPRCVFHWERCTGHCPTLIEELQPVGAPARAVACHLYDPAERRPRPLLDASVASAGMGALGANMATEATPGVLVDVNRIRRVFDVSKPLLNRLIEGGARQYLRAVDDVSFRIATGETFALVGESGSGKSTVARMVVGLSAPTTGTVKIDGQPMGGNRDNAARRKLRRQIQMIFQDPYASLNPRWRIDAIVSEPIRAFGLVEGKTAIEHRVDELLSLVGLDHQAKRKFPHQFSGGQRQRIAIARALASNARFIVCDEPTSALDVSVQAQILNLMRDLQDELGLTYLFISHNLAVVRHMATRIGVMYLGRIVEISGGRELFEAPRHPYTQMLLDAVPDIGLTGRKPNQVLGEVPNPIQPPPGCTFNPRCVFANDRCRIEIPALVDGVACHAVEEGRIKATSASDPDTGLGATWDRRPVGMIGQTGATPGPALAS